MSIIFGKRKRKITIIFVAIVLALAIIVGASAIYLGDYYPADLASIQAFAPMSSVTYHTLDDGTMVFEPENAIAGFIFYPGGKVEHTAYQPLMAACAEQGIMCFLVKMPFNLAVFDINAADGIQEKYPEIEKWYIGGHSLGGSMAASYVDGHTDGYDGVILLGSYSTSDLSDTDLEVLSIYGSEDKVINKEKYEANKTNLPENFTEIVIEGGCHAYFGMYGGQDGDGTPVISNEEQIYITSACIADLILG